MATNLNMSPQLEQIHGEIRDIFRALAYASSSLFLILTLQFCVFISCFILDWFIPSVNIAFTKKINILAIFRGVNVINNTIDRYYVIFFLHWRITNLSYARLFFLSIWILGFFFLVWKAINYWVKFRFDVVIVENLGVLWFLNQHSRLVM
jgi:hypothetical protein